MNSLMLIQVRVQLANANRQIAALQAQVGRLQAQTRATNATAAEGFFGGRTQALANITRMGNRIQWVGRQLQYNFTLPLVLAGAAATKWELDNQKAMVRVSKVYGDGSKVFNRLSRTELPALGKAFEALSNRFGVARADVINIAADWAAAGASGVALAKSTKLTLETMILGEMDASTATRALIAIQAQFGLQVDSNKKGVIDLSKVIDILNMSENQTGTTLSDLITSLARSAGMARTAGIDIQHLAAMTAALVPAAGTASEAGNSLKTIISRVIKPTGEAADMMKAMGINTNSAAYASLNGTEKLTLLAQSFEKLSQNQQAAVATTIAGRWQLNRFIILMHALTNQNSYYNKSLRATSSEAANFAQKQKELNQVLSSNPQRLMIIWTTLKNAMADIIQPAIPAILAIAQAIAHMVQSFENLSPATQKLIMFGLLFLALVGPVTRYVGSIIALVGILGDAVVIAATIMGKALMVVPMMFLKLFTGLKTLFIRALPFLIKIFTGPWGWALLAIGAVIGAIQANVGHGLDGVLNWVRQFGQHLYQLFKPMIDFFKRMGDDIVAAFNKLPQGIQNAILAVVRMVAWGAEQVYKLFQYLNPFAHHSPSLVDNVTGGMTIVRSEHTKTALSAQKHTSTIATAHQQVTNTLSTANSSADSGSLGSLDTLLRKVTQDLARFKAASKGLIPGEWADGIKAIKDQFPQLLPQFMQLVHEYNELSKAADRVQGKVDQQQAVVDRWQKKLDAANKSLQDQQDLLDKLENKLNRLKDAYDRHQQTMQNFANAPIKGMQAFNDQIFANDLAQKKLQLRMLQWTQANGSIDDTRNKMQGLAGDIETLRGTITNLHSQGAGSDVLGPLNDQLKTLEDSYTSLDHAQQNSPIDALQKQIDLLDQQGQILNLQKDIKFDPLTQQIQKMVNTEKELSYQQIVNGINRQKAAMDQLKPRITAQTAAVKEQQKVVNAATRQRDRVQAQYDRESKQLDRLQARYQKLADAISNVRDALSGMSSAATAAQQKAAGAGSGSVLGKRGSYPDVGGNVKIGREGGLTDQSGLINKFTQQIQDEASKAFGGFSHIFDPIKHGWNTTWAWIKKNVGPVFVDLGHGIQAGVHSLGQIFAGTAKSDFGKRLHSIFGTVADIIGTAVKSMIAIFQLFWPDLKRVFSSLWNIAKTIWKDLIPALQKFWKAIKPLAMIIGVLLLASLKIVVSILSTALGPAIVSIIKIISGLINIISDVITFVISLIKLAIDPIIAIFTGKWGKVWTDAKNVFGSFFSFFKDAWNTLYETVRGVIVLVKNIVMGFVHAIVEFFSWLWDKLVGHSIIPDMMKAIVHWFNWLIKPVKEAFKLVWAGLKLIWNNVAVPIFHTISHFIDGIRDAINAVIQPAKQAFHALWDVIKTAWQAVGAPIFDTIANVIGSIEKAFDRASGPASRAFKAIWNGIKEAWNLMKSNVFQPILDTFKTIINAFIHAINFLIRGINAVSGLLHLGFTINTIDTWGGVQLARGGVVPSRGMRTDGPRAIVGEGRSAYPEYVIPTDPSYRENAMQLWKQAGHRIKMLASGGTVGGTPTENTATHNTGTGVVANYPRGTITTGQVNRDIRMSMNFNAGVMSDSRSLMEQASDAVSGFVKTITGFFVRNAAKAIYWPLQQSAKEILKGIPIEFIREMGNSVLDSIWHKLDQIGRKQDSGIDTDPVKRFTPVAAEMVMREYFRYGSGGNSGGNTKRALWAAIATVPDVLARLNKESGGDPNAINNWDSNAAAGIPSKGLMQVIDPTFQAYKNTSFAPNDIWDPRANMYAGLNYAYHRYGSISAGMNQPGGYRTGGIANHRVFLHGAFGEAGPEILAPLTPLWAKLDKIERKVETVQSSGGGDTIMNFYGDLSFPNIKTTADADGFIRNLKAAAGKKSA